MHPRHRHPGNGYRSGAMGVGGVAAGSRMSPDNSIRGHGMYNSEYRYNRGFGRGQTKPLQAAQPTPRRTDVFMEAGRLATEYLVSKGLLPPNALPGKWHNGGLKNQVGAFQGFGQQEEDSVHLPPEGRTSALARLGNPVDAGSGRRRFADEHNPTGSRNYMRGRWKYGSFKNYDSDWGREMGRSGSSSDTARASPDREGDNDTISGYKKEKQVDNDLESGGQKSSASESAPKSDGAADSEAALDNLQFHDQMATKATSCKTGKDIAPETDVELTKGTDDVKLLDKESFEFKNGISSDKLEKQNEMEDASIKHCAEEGYSVDKNGGDLLSLCRFAKVPTKTRSSLTTRVLKVDPVPSTVEEKNHGTQESNCDMGPLVVSEVHMKDVSVEDSSVDGQSNQVQSSKTPDSEFSKGTPGRSVEDVGELGPVYIEQGKHPGSSSLPDRFSMKEQESSEGPPGFGRCSSMIMERGEKRTAQHSDISEGSKRAREWVSVNQNDACLNLSNLREKQPTLQEGRKSPGKDVILVAGEERPIDMSLFQRGDSAPCTEYVEEKQLFPGSFKICDLNLMEATEVNENPDSDPILFFPSFSERKKEPAPVDVDLSMSNNCITPDKHGRGGANGKEFEVIDLENDSVQDDKAFHNEDRKADTVFTGLESFPNQAQGANDMSDAQDGYGLMISELLGNDIPSCSSVPADINSLHSEMGLHSGEGILGDDESIYMSLGEIPISFLRVWEQAAQEYDKPF